MRERNCRPALLLAGIAGVAALTACESSDDDDDGGAVVSIVDATAVENDATVSFRVFAEGAHEGITFDYATTTTGGTVPGEDFTATSASATIASGESEVFVTVPLLDDSELEAAETLVVEIVAAEGASLGDAIGQALISDDEPVEYCQVIWSSTGSTMDRYDILLIDAPRERGRPAR